VLVSKEVARELGATQRELEKRVSRLQALVVEHGVRELEIELGQLAGSIHRHGGLLRAVLDAVTEDAIQAIASDPPPDSGG
jgi:hypothetical protein